MVVPIHQYRSSALKFLRHERAPDERAKCQPKDAADARYQTVDWHVAR